MKFLSPLSDFVEDEPVFSEDLGYNYLQVSTLKKSFIFTMLCLADLSAMFEPVRVSDAAFSSAAQAQQVVHEQPEVPGDYTLLLMSGREIILQNQSRMMAGEMLRAVGAFGYLVTRSAEIIPRHALVEPGTYTVVESAGSATQLITKHLDGGSLIFEGDPNACNRFFIKHAEKLYRGIFNEVCSFESKEELVKIISKNPGIGSFKRSGDKNLYCSVKSQDLMLIILFIDDKHITEDAFCDLFDLLKVARNMAPIGLGKTPPLSGVHWFADFLHFMATYGAIDAQQYKYGQNLVHTITKIQNIVVRSYPDGFQGHECLKRLLSPESPYRDLHPTQRWKCWIHENRAEIADILASVIAERSAVIAEAEQKPELRIDENDPYLKAWAEMYKV